MIIEQKLELNSINLFSCYLSHIRCSSKVVTLLHLSQKFLTDNISSIKYISRPLNFLEATCVIQNSGTMEPKLFHNAFNSYIYYLSIILSYKNPEKPKGLTEK